MKKMLNRIIRENINKMILKEYAVSDMLNSQEMDEIIYHTNAIVKLFNDLKIRVSKEISPRLSHLTFLEKGVHDFKHVIDTMENFKHKQQ